MVRTLLNPILGLSLLPALVAGRPLGPSQGLEADERQAQQWLQQIEKCLDRDELDEALSLAEKLYQQRKEKHGPDRWQTWDAHFQVEELRRLAKRPAAERRQLRGAVALNNKGFLTYLQGHFRESERFLRAALAIRQKALPPAHPELARNLSHLAGTLSALGQRAEAEQLDRQALAIRQKALPAEHLQIGQSLNNLGSDLHARGKDDEAEPLQRQALAILQKALPPGHPDLAKSLDNLGLTLRALDRYAEAEVVHRQALALMQKALPSGHLSLAQVLNNLAVCLRAQARYAEAELQLRQALAIREKALGPAHFKLASILNNLGCTLFDEGRYAEAEAVHRQALAILQRALPPGHLELLRIFTNLAMDLDQQGEQDKHAEAGQLMRQALAGFQKSAPPTAGPVAEIIDDLTLMASRGLKGQEIDVEKLYRQNLALQQKGLPGHNPGLASAAVALGKVLAERGKATEAEALVRQALGICQKAYAPGHPNLSSCSEMLGIVLAQQEKYAEAAQDFEAASANFEIARLRGGATGSARALFSARKSPQAGLAAMRARLGQPRRAWSAAEMGLARGLLDDVTSLRQAHLDPDQRSRLGQFQKELAVLSRKILQAHLLPELDPGKEKELQQWRARSMELAGALGSLAAEQSRKQVAPLGEVQQHLSADAALVFWVDFLWSEKTEGEHWGCVVRSTGHPAWVRLPGSADKEHWTPDDQLLDEHLAQALRRPMSGAWHKLAAALYRQRLQPLEPHLKGVRHLIAVPAGWMAGVPLEVLTDRYQVSYTPSGTMHARLHQEHRPLEPSLLALGDPVFRRTPPPEPPDHGLYLLQVLPGSNAAKAGLQPGDVLLSYHGGKLQRFEDLQLVKEGAAVAITLWRLGQVQDRTVAAGPLGIALAKEPAAEAIRKQRQADQWLVQRSGDFADLPSTRLEVEALGKLFTKKRLLLGSHASQQHLEELAASGELARYRILHFATHGEMHPSRPSLCALILAQDKLPDPAEQLRQGKKVYNGRLTAEALLEWKLDADLMVLSACETGLGPQGGGDGFLGFSQVLFRQGAHSLVLSLWKVDDVATALLMQRFYQNLLGQNKGQEHLGRAASLAEAKRWLRKLSRKEAAQHAMQLGGGVWRSRMEKLHTAPATAPLRPEADRPFAHPYYWAAFILLGDPD
jgi:CHAT domain-containing protein/Tfp pilus assembly protein PilF